MSVHKSTVLELNNIAKDTIEITTERPENFDFKAGQNVELYLEDADIKDEKGNSRVFSIVSAPYEKDLLKFAFRDTSSAFKEAIKNAGPGALLEIDGPYGSFTVPDNFSGKLVFIAGGIGITPFISILKNLTHKGRNIDVTLFYANKNKEFSAYLDTLENIESSNDNFKLIEHFGMIKKVDLKNIVNEDSFVHYFVSGPPEMVHFVRRGLANLGVGEFNIHSEEFTGY